MFRVWCLFAHRSLPVIGVIVSLAMSGSQALADDLGQSSSKFASGTGAVLYLAVGTGLPLLRDGKNAKKHTLRALDSLASSLLLSEGAKRLVQEQRPNTLSHDSFPSGHATVAFSVATMESAYHPKEAPLWYAGATLIAASRVALHDHFIGDVVAGAALGYGVSRLELSCPHGLLLSPFIPADGKGAGLAFRTRF